MIGQLSAGFLALFVIAATPAVASAGSRYDGLWNLNFVTQRGGCDPTYDFNVRVTNGIVSHPVLVRFTGRVSPAGAVRASVTAGSKFAAGTGKLKGTTGRGTWAGYSGTARCSGYWIAVRS